MGIKPAIIIFTKTGTDTAKRIAKLTGGQVHACGSDGENAAELLPRLYREGVPIIGICAAGILIRLLSASLANKQNEPAVIAVSSDGAHVVPLLGGHHGANILAHQIAEALGSIAAITTASDARFERGLDEPPQGYVLANPVTAKTAMAAILNGAEIALSGEASWLQQAGYPITDDGAVKIVISESPASDTLTYHPATLIAGVGCERGVSSKEVIDLITNVLAKNNLAPQSLAAIATIDLKADESALNVAAAFFNVPLRLFTAKELAEEADRLPNPSELVRAEVGTPGVAEAAAIKAGELMVEKQKSKRATCAIGRAPLPLDVATFGRATGQLHIVGIGPGEAIQRTASTIAALQHTSDWVGYGLYLDLIEDLQTGQAEHRFPLGDEEPRVRHALELAAEGKKVALICSGDAQIYAMGALVFELLNADGARALSDAARRAHVESHPGISAFQMASARAGALIGHDFCCISLSDLLTPKEDILKRLNAAAQGDFVTAFYNPRSMRRTDLIEAAKRIYLDHRPPDTPVIIAKNLGRAEEQVRVVTLADFDPTEIDMLTIVLFGASTSRAFTRGDGQTVTFTPRGYERKVEAAE